MHKHEEQRKYCRLVLNMQPELHKRMKRIALEHNITLTKWVTQRLYNALLIDENYLNTNNEE